MSNVIDFPERIDEFKHVTYTAGASERMGAATTDRKIEIVRTSPSKFAVITQNGITEHDRESLSEFLWLAAYFLDSEQRNIPDGKIIGCDYEDDKS